MSPMNNCLLRPTNNYDADALRYINAVQVADGQALEPEVRTAIDAFVRGCKSDSAGYAGDPTRTVWDALQACCIMCGARTISGALVPLVGDSPTPYNFTASDYDRITGIKGDGSTTYLDSGRANDADGQDDRHMAVFVDSITLTGKGLIGSLLRSPSLSVTQLFYNAPNNMTGFCCSGTVSNAGTFSGNESFVGISRQSSSSQTLRSDSVNTVTPAPSVSPTPRPEYVFARNDSDGTIDHTDARLAFYSIGSSLSLSNLDNRVTTLIAAIAAALS